MVLHKELVKIFEKDNWNTPVKVVQKSINFSLTENERTCEIYSYCSDERIGYIECGHVYNLLEMGISERITNNDVFPVKFDKLCRRVVGKDFKMFRGRYTNDNWFKCFVNEQHGSGVVALFWLFYHLYVYNARGIKHVVISNIDGLLHPSSMVHLASSLRYEDIRLKIIFLMNNDILMSNMYMDIDDLYIMHTEDIKNIRQCTDRELRIAHNLQNLYRAGEFDERRENK